MSDPKNGLDGAKTLLLVMTKWLRELSTKPEIAKLSGPEALSLAAIAFDAWIPELDDAIARFLVEGEAGLEAFASNQKTIDRVCARLEKRT